MLNFGRKEMSIQLKEGGGVALGLCCWRFTCFQIPQFFGISFIIIIFKFSEDKKKFGLRSRDNEGRAIIWFGVRIIYVALKMDLKVYFKKCYVQ